MLDTGAGFSLRREVRTRLCLQKTNSTNQPTNRQTKGPVAIQVARKNYLFGGGWRSWTPLFLLLPGFGLYLLIAVGPSLATFVYSFTDATGVRGAPVNWIGFENYDEFLFRGLASRDNIAALQRTLIFSVVVTSRPVQPGPGDSPSC